MITQQQAEELAKKAVADYLTACNMQSPNQIGNLLMKLCSVAGVMMANAEGSSASAWSFLQRVVRGGGQGRVVCGPRLRPAVRPAGPGTRRGDWCRTPGQRAQRLRQQMGALHR